MAGARELILETIRSPYCPQAVCTDLVKNSPFKPYEAQILLGPKGIGFRPIRENEDEYLRLCAKLKVIPYSRINYILTSGGFVPQVTTPEVGLKDREAQLLINKGLIGGWRHHDIAIYTRKFDANNRGVLEIFRDELFETLLARGYNIESMHLYLDILRTTTIAAQPYGVGQGARMNLSERCARDLPHRAEMDTIRSRFIALLEKHHLPYDCIGQNTSEYLAARP